MSHSLLAQLYCMPMLISNVAWLVLFLPRLDAHAASTDPCQEDTPDNCWMSYLRSPPQAAVALAQNLAASADAVVDSLPSQLEVTGDFDVSISGGGNYDAYYMGVSMVFSRVRSIKQHRFIGASAGGMMPFELQLKSENTTLLTHLSYGLLAAEYPLHFSDPFAAAQQDHDWRLMAAWQTETYADQLFGLGNKVFLALSCLDPLPKLVIVSHFTAESNQAMHAFMATGTLLEEYEGKMCSDGGAMSGPDMTPLFQDGLRPQVIVNLMKTGYPGSMVYKIDTQQWADLVLMGQQEAAEFLTTGKVSRNSAAITICSMGSKVDNNICEQAESATGSCSFWDWFMNFLGTGPCSFWG